MLPWGGEGNTDVFSALMRSEDLSESDHEKCQVRVPPRPGISLVSPLLRGLEGKKRLFKKRGKGLKIDEVGNSSYLHIWGLPDSRKNKLTQKIEI